MSSAGAARAALVNHLLLNPKAARRLVLAARLRSPREENASNQAPMDPVQMTSSGGRREQKRHGSCSVATEERLTRLIKEPGLGPCTCSLLPILCRPERLHAIVGTAQSDVA